MKILLVRHAIAMDRDTFSRSGANDSERPITAEGAKKMAKGAKGLKKIIPELKTIASSPWDRALQTAEILSDAFHIKDVIVDSSFEPKASYSERLENLRKANKDLVALVGHEPDLGEFCSWLITGKVGFTFEFKKGGAALIELLGNPMPGQGSLLWMIPPKGLRALGKNEP